MKKKALYKDIRREIRKSFGRFLSILVLIMLGVAFFVGLKAVGPDMMLTATNYFEEYKLADMDVQSTFGLDESDRNLLEQVEGVKEVVFGYSADVLLQDLNLVAKVYSMPLNEAANMNTYDVTEGRLPTQSGEVAIDKNLLLSKDFQVGDKITFVQNDGSAFTDTFQQDTYTIVGIVSSPKYIERDKRGSSQLGNGEVDGFAVIPADDFQSDVYTLATLTFDNTVGLEAYSSAYEEKMEDNVAVVEKALKNQPAKRLAAVKEEAQAEIKQAEDQVAAGRQELADQEEKLEEAKQQLEEGKAQYSESETELSNQLDEAESEITANEQQLQNVRTQLDEAAQEIAEGEQAIASSKEQLENSKNELAAAQEELTAKKAALEQAGLLYGDALAEVKAAQAELDGQQARLQSAQTELAQKEASLEESKSKLASGETEYANGQTQLGEAKAQYESSKESGYAQLADAKAQLDQNEAEYEEKAALFQEEKEKAEKELADAEAEIATSKDKLAALEEPTYYVMDRTNNPGYLEYRDNAKRLTSLATVFPVLFFLVAILVCLTTMTRMVDEQRSQIGLLKALGYSQDDIMVKFLLYGSLASIVGATFGLVIGFELLPRVIFDAYSIMYGFKAVDIAYYPQYIVISILVALLCTGFTAIVTTWTELKENAAALMRPKAPKIGKRILLERIDFIWKRLNFTSKVTARNIFRYKKRMFMTIFGVAGCTALIFTGFGLRGSINDIVPMQYEEIMSFDAMMVYDVNASDEAMDKYEQLLQKTDNITSRTTISQTNMTGIQKGANNQDITVVVPASINEYETFINLRNRKTHHKQSFSDEGAIITEKLAQVFDLGVGDTITVQSSDNERFQVKIIGISEMYFGHYMYMTPAYYESTFHEKVSYNTDLVKLDDTSEKWQNNFSEKLLDDTAAVNVTYANKISEVLNDTMDSLNVVVVVLITSAALLAFVVLYNLTNINISERIRELSTIKVLGFYPKEVTMYVYRENIFLTLLGIGFGYILGYFLHGFVLTTAEIDQMMISRTIHVSSYVYSALLTLIFSSFVMLVMHWKLRRIDMIEALKSVD